MSDHRYAALTRREFVTMAGAGVAVILLRPAWTLAKDSKQAIPDLRFIVVSDTHLGRKNRKASERKWTQAASQIAKSKCDFVLHLGDIVDGGREAQYPIYKKIRDSTGKKFYEVPGNHDPQKLFEKYLRKPVDMVFDHKRFRFILLNNTRTTSHLGFITPKQLAWMDKRCAEAAAKGLFVIVCAHVPFHTNKNPESGWYVRAGQKQFYALVKKYRDRILMIMGGHFHNGIRGWRDNEEVEEILFPSVDYNFDRRLTGRAPGYNLPEFRAGYVLVEIDKGVMTLKYKPVGYPVKVSKKYRMTKLPAPPSGDGATTRAAKAD